MESGKKAGPWDLIMFRLQPKPSICVGEMKYFSPLSPNKPFMLKWFDNCYYSHGRPKIMRRFRDYFAYILSTTPWQWLPAIGTVTRKEKLLTIFRTTGAGKRGSEMSPLRRDRFYPPKFILGVGVVQNYWAFPAGDPDRHHTVWASPDAHPSSWSWLAHLLVIGSSSNITGIEQDFTKDSSRTVTA